MRYLHVIGYVLLNAERVTVAQKKIPFAWLVLNHVFWGVTPVLLVNNVASVVCSEDLATK
jgi:hypothetical protein